VNSQSEQQSLLRPSVISTIRISQLGSGRDDGEGAVQGELGLDQLLLGIGKTKVREDVSAACVAAKAGS